MSEKRVTQSLLLPELKFIDERHTAKTRYFYCENLINNYDFEEWKMAYTYCDSVQMASQRAEIESRQREDFVFNELDFIKALINGVSYNSWNYKTKRIAKKKILSYLNANVFSEQILIKNLIILSLTEKYIEVFESKNLKVEISSLTDEIDKKVRELQKEIGRFYKKNKLSYSCREYKKIMKKELSISLEIRLKLLEILNKLNAY